MTISRNLSKLAEGADTSGVLAISNGGTGQTTANAALNAVLPSQSGNNGKALVTDGTNTSWSTAGISQAKVTGITFIFSI